jgi:tetratricopeptide (TPR) repeat protein
MNGRALLVIGCAIVFASCRSAEEAAVPAPGPVTRESLFRQAHQLFLLGERDSADACLREVLAIDPAYQPALRDLASLWYERAGQLSAPEARVKAQRTAFRYFASLEAQGEREAETYERLCELALGLKDKGGFLLYARRNAERYPYDRQYYNLGLAYFEAGEYASCVKSQKEALEKFKASNYVGGFYRQMGRAYMKMDRDQTAERTLAAGVQAVDARLSEVRPRGGEMLKRLQDDKISMLLLLKKLHLIYKAEEKLQKVEQQLRDAGYGK